MSFLLNSFPRFIKSKSASMDRCFSQVQKGVEPTPASSSSATAPKDFVKVSAAKKRMFVLFGLFKSTKDIPDAVSMHTMARNMDRFRVRASLVMMAVASLGALSSILLAKGVVEDIETEKEKRS